MIVKSIQTSLIASSALLASFGLVQAEPTTSTPSEAASEGSENAGDDTRSPDEILAQARVGLDRMEATSDNIDRMLRSARGEKDIVKALCLDDKLNQIDVAVRTAEDRVASMDGAAKTGNMGRLRTDDKVLEALFIRGNEIAAEANQCIGAEQGSYGKTTLTVKEDPKIPKGDTSSLPPNVIISTPPVAASPTL